MQSCCVLNETDFSYVDFVTQPAGMRELLLSLSKPGSDTGIIPYSYSVGSCDIFPMWYVSAAVAYMKESGDYSIFEEICLKDIFNSICALSGEFAGMAGAAADGGKLSMENTIALGLFLCVCREYLRLCRFLDMSMEAASAAVRLKWIRGFYSDLILQFKKFELHPYVNKLLCDIDQRRRIKGPADFRGEVSQFIRSGIYEILNEQDKGDAQNYWLATASEWSRKATAEVIFGIKPDFQGLSVNPCMPDSFGSVEIKRSFRNAVYDIRLRNPLHNASDIRKLVVDNAEYLGNLLPIFADGKTHRVEITMGSFD